MATNPFLEAAIFESAEAIDPRFEIRCLPDGRKALFSRPAFEPGDVLLPFGHSELRRRPNRYTVQTGPDEHIILDPEFLLYLNHHCEPNCFFDVSARCLRALLPIAPGDEMTFFYPSTEWSMAEAFECHCGSAKCLGRIQGAAHIPPRTLDRYELSEHIRSRIA